MNNGERKASECMPLVSIITPSYNQAQFLEETILSVLTQDYGNIEYIIIDGGSTDGSVDIIRKYQHHLTYWISEPDAGQSDALNKGFRIATGQIVAWLNSDDTYNAGAVREAVSALQAHPEVALVYSDCCIINEESQSIDIMRTFDYDPITVVLETKIPQPTVFMRANVLREVGYIDLTLHYAMDCDLWLRIGARYPMLHLPGTSANFRVVAGTKTTSHPERFGPELLRSYEQFFATSQLAAEVRHLKPRALARIHWRTGLEFYAVGDYNLGKCHCTQAIQEPVFVMQDTDYIVQRLVHTPHTIEHLHSPKLIKTILRDLPIPLVVKWRIGHRVWALHAATRFFQAHKAADYRQVRRSGTIVITHDIKWLKHRGFLSIYARAVLGPRLVKLIRVLINGNHSVLRENDNGT